MLNFHLILLPAKQFSFLSQYEVDRMKQEEDRKIEAMGSMDHLRSNELEQVLEEEEEYSVDTVEEDEEEEEESEDDVQHVDVEEVKGSPQSQIVHISRVSPTSPDVNVNVSVNVQTPNRAFIQPSRSTSSISSAGSPTGSIRTAKAEKRLKEKLSKEVRL